MTTEISKHDNMIDTRNITARIEELEESKKYPEYDGEFEELYQDEYDKLKAFADEIGESAFENQETLINDVYFEEYAEEFAVDIGLIDGANSWPATCIDWERAARELQIDYSSADLDGWTFWHHS